MDCWQKSWEMGCTSYSEGKKYTEPTEPPKYPEELDKDSIKDKHKRAIAELDEQKIAYAMCKCFHREVGANI